MRFFFVAGETSGDTHGASLIQALRAQAPDLECEGLGGVQMEAAGMTLRYDLAGEAFMGFVEVIKHLRPIRRLFLDTEAHLRETRPDALILIDYPGFNLRLAKAAHALGIPVIYYISPQIWAWKKKRIHTLKRYVSKMLVILPFEEVLYQKVGLDCAYVGHPQLDHIAEYQVPAVAEDAEWIVGLLPGSRAQEIERLMPMFIDTARGIHEKYPDIRFVTPCVDDTRAAQIKAIVGDFPLEIQVGGMYDVLSTARFCLVASGTATLETGLFGVPMIISYIVNPVTYWLGSLLVNIKFIGMVNILMDRGIVPEFIQYEATREKVLPTALALIEDTPERAQMLEDLAAMRKKLGDGGASARAATAILEYFVS